MNHDIEKIQKNPILSGQIGENAIWDGPLSKKGFPMGVGNSNGITGMEVSKYHTDYSSGPITSKSSLYSKGSKKNV
ncbi:MAG: hypothetical protein H8E16_12075 [Flavobacteriales bacterium]|nr:hypothetical protein [Flavobacteriales bacterium]